MSGNRRPNGRASGPPTGGRSISEGKSKQIKLVLLGESGVGKSSIALRFVRGEFNENGEATIGGIQTRPQSSYQNKIKIQSTRSHQILQYILYFNLAFYHSIHF